MIRSWAAPKKKGPGSHYFTNDRQTFRAGPLVLLFQILPTVILGSLWSAAPPCVSSVCCFSCWDAGALCRLGREVPFVFENAEPKMVIEKAS